MSYKKFDRKVSRNPRDVHHCEMEKEYLRRKAREESYWQYFKIFGIIILALIIILGGI